MASLNSTVRYAHVWMISPYLRALAMWIPRPCNAVSARLLPERLSPAPEDDPVFLDYSEALILVRPEKGSQA